MKEKVQTSIDVVVPSYRFNEKLLTLILQLQHPDWVTVNFFIVVDQSGIKPSQEMNELIKKTKTHLIFNETNLGAAMSRNVGIRSGKGDWILLLDDDVIVSPLLLNTYADAVSAYPQETGFIGFIELPPPTTRFSKAIVASGAMDIFSIAKKKDFFAWGATANIMIRRSALGEVLFSPQFPKSGGGEDVDFFLRLRKRNNYRNLKTLPHAAVVHPWWNEEKPEYKKPFRYGLGNSWLGQLNKAHTYRDFLNTPETLLLLILAGIVIALFCPVYLITIPLIFAGVVIIEFIANIIQTHKRQPQSGLQVAFYVMLLRLSQETGVLWGKILRGRFDLIGQRFHDDGTIRKINFYRTNTYRIAKWILYAALAILIWKFI